MNNEYKARQQLLLTGQLLLIIRSKFFRNRFIMMRHININIVNDFIQVIWAITVFTYEKSFDIKPVR